MKVRRSFVTNSSSSSYIIAIKKDITLDDVEILEEVYLHLRPWMKSHTNVSLYSDDEKPMCACCGSDKIGKLTKYFYTNTGRYEMFRCLDCGAILRSRKTTISKNKNILVSVPNR